MLRHQLETRHTTVSAGEATTEVWILLGDHTSGCHHYTPGKPTHAAGLRAAPPTAEP